MMLGTGTTRNEQLHRELKSWGRNIMQAHIGRLSTGLSIFVLAKLLTHSSAAYSPTLTQASQSRLLCQIEGKIRVMSFFPPVTKPADLDGSISEKLDYPRVVVNGEITKSRKEEQTKESKMWTKRNLKRHHTRPNDTNIFKIRSNKRIYSTK